jgi:hypothetical protein
MALAAGVRRARPRRWPARLAWALWALVVLGLTVVTPWLNQLARQAGRTDLGSDADSVAYGLVAFSAATGDFLVAILGNAGREQIMLETGIALGLSRPVLLIREPATAVPASLEGLPQVLLGDADPADSLRFQLEVFLQTLKPAPARRQSPPHPGYYSYDFQGWHFVVLNTTCSVLPDQNCGGAMLTWLKQDLAAHPAKCTVVMGHHPYFASASPFYGIQSCLRSGQPWS